MMRHQHGRSGPGRRGSRRRGATLFDGGGDRLDAVGRQSRELLMGDRLSASGSHGDTPSAVVTVGPSTREGARR